MISLIDAELRDELNYEVVCRRGHRNRLALWVPRFAILIDAGACALHEGYYREAVSSFAAGLERFYEYWLRAMLAHMGVPSGAIAATWKAMAAQSERQFGAYTALYCSVFKRPPDVLNTTEREFRNDAVHKGKIPSRASTHRFGQRVIDLVALQATELQSELGPEKVTETLRDEVERDGRARFGSDFVPDFFLHVNTIVGVGREPVVRGTLEERMRVTALSWRQPLAEMLS